MKEYELPLFEIFTRLRQADVPLGVDEYALLMRALQAGFGIESQEALAQLCRMLWIKSDEDERLFRRHFAEVMASQPLDETNILAQSASTKLENVPSLTSIAPTSDAEQLSPLSIEKKAATAVLHTASEDEIPYNRFIRSDEYFPVTRRQMKQSWRYLRRPIDEPGPPLELNVDATINEIGRNGELLDFVWSQSRRNRAELLLLIDQGGSMVPFHALSRRLAETALRGGRVGKTNIYYFHNCPTTHLYRSSAYQGARVIEDVLETLHNERTGILIFSDAGAARRSFSQTRINLTNGFLNQLTKRFRYIVWVNPTPHSRWFGTSAGKIQESVAMFEFNRRGLDDAISLLRGRPAPFLRAMRYKHD
jgi:uncharacterized protein